jgi:hypothetical protein
MDIEELNKKMDNFITEVSESGIFSFIQQANLAILDLQNYQKSQDSNIYESVHFKMNDQKI